MKNRIVLILTCVLVIFTTMLTGCRTKEDTIAIICVRDSNNAPVVNAQVMLYGSGTEGVISVNKEAQTNSAGEAIFNFNDEYQLGQAGYAILDISVMSGSESASGIIKIVEETTNKEIILLGQ